MKRNIFFCSSPHPWPPAMLAAAYPKTIPVNFLSQFFRGHVKQIFSSQDKVFKAFQKILEYAKKPNVLIFFVVGYIIYFVRVNIFLRGSPYLIAKEWTRMKREGRVACPKFGQPALSSKFYNH